MYGATDSLTALQEMNEKHMKTASLFTADFVQTWICLTAQNSAAKKAFFFPNWKCI